MISYLRMHLRKRRRKIAEEPQKHKSKMRILSRERVENLGAFIYF